MIHIPILAEVSVPGYNTAQELELIRTKVVTFSPDMVMLVYSDNDTRLCNWLKPDLTIWNFLYHKSHLVHFILKRIDVKMEFEVTDKKMKDRWNFFRKETLGMFYPDRPLYPYPGLEETTYIGYNPPGNPEDVPPKYHYMIGYTNYRNHLASIKEYLAEKQITFVSTGWFDRRALAINKKLAVPYLCNIRRAFSNNFEEIKPYLMLPDPHWNHEGHQIVLIISSPF